MNPHVDVASSLMCLVFVAFACLLLLAIPVPPWLRGLTVAVLATRLSFGLLNFLFEWFVAPDAKTYHLQAVALSKGQDPELYVAGKEAWPQVLSFVYTWSSPNPVIPVVLNAVLCTLMLPLVFWITEEFRAGAGKYGVGLLLVMPAWWLWGLPGLREPLVWLLSLVALWGLVASLRPNNRAGLIVFATTIMLFAWVRGPLALVIGVAGGGALLIAQRPSPFRIVALGVAVPAIVAVVSPQLQQIPALQDGTVELIKGELSRADSGFDVSNPVALAARVLTGPWPWEIPSLGLLAIPDMVFLWVALVLAVGGVRALRSRAALLVLPAAGILASLAATSGNYGTMLRLRTQALVWLLPLLAAGYAVVRDRRRIRQSMGRAVSSSRRTSAGTRPTSRVGHGSNLSRPDDS